MEAKVYTYAIETQEEQELFDNITAYINNKLKKEQLVIENINLETTEAGKADVCLSIGGQTSISLSKEIKRIFSTPSLKDMIIDPTTKKETFSKIEEFLLYIKEEKNNKVVLEKEEVTFGEKNADILITEEEANHLLKIKNILGDFDKVIVTKGELKVEFIGNKNG